MQNLDSDPYVWLEDRNGAVATAWAKSESDITRRIFEGDARFQKTYQDLQDILLSKDKMLAVRLLGDFVYNTLQNAQHVRGIWRRTTVAEFQSPNPHWETLIDMDQLCADENESWVFKYFEKSRTSDRCLIYLSKDGQDAAEIREFSLATKAFVADGFFFPESKSGLAWYDDDQLIVCSALTKDHQTRSGYARKCFLWNRGEAFSQAKLIFEGDVTDVMLSASVQADGGSTLPLLIRYANQEHIEKFVIQGSRVLLLSLPKDSWPEAVRDGKMFFCTRSAWRSFKAGTLLAAPIKELLKPEVASEKLIIIFEPGARSSHQWVVSNRSSIYVGISENVRTQIYEVILKGARSSMNQLMIPSQSSFEPFAVDSESEHIFFREESFLLAPTIHWLRAGESRIVKQGKSYFSADGLSSVQYWARSADGTEIPYTLLSESAARLNGDTPTILYGYGGFNDAILPVYNPQVGKAWLEAGGAYVFANIRGGNEFGPEWHKSAMLENKQRSYDDFIAIAEDLIRRKITSPRRLGITGRSNGGLLVGAVVTQRPELFNAVVCGVPLLDMLRYSKLPPGSSWMDEYGDPDDPKMRAVIAKYSPYHNVHADRKYPKILFHTAEADDRVHPAHARKMTARMKEMGHEVLFYESTDGGGHAGGGVSMKDQAKTAAYVYTYFYQQLMD